MGTWGAGTFENDTAADWVYQLEEATDLTIVEAAFDAVAEGATEYLDADVAAIGLAAAEVVAALRGHPARDLQPEVQAWVAAHSQAVPDELVERARGVVETVSAGSELQELWEESGEPAAWEAAVADLRSRLR